MESLVAELQDLVTKAQAALDTAHSQVNVTVNTPDPVWVAVQAVLTNNGWTTPVVPEAPETPGEGPDTEDKSETA